MGRGVGYRCAETSGSLLIQLNPEMENFMKCAFLSMGLLLLAVASANAQQHASADLVIVHGRVWTVDPAHPQAEAVAIQGSRIIAVGTDTEIANWVGPRTKNIDAQGKRLLPAFLDP